LQYAHETQHEKILRGLAVGIALTMYGRLEEADILISTLCKDKDPILRRSGMYTLAMAYCGTGNNQAIRKLLHVAVSVFICAVLFLCFLCILHTQFMMGQSCLSICSYISSPKCLGRLLWSIFVEFILGMYEDFCEIWMQKLFVFVSDNVRNM
jgi:26S proteasome regulatory subunit N2